MNEPNLSSRLLHLGCGLEAPSEWLNVDGSYQAVFARWPRLKRWLVASRIYPRSQATIPWPTNVLRLDLRRKLPFPNDSFEAIYSSHTFEHLYRSEAQGLARECHRVLTREGVCRIVVPDLSAAIARYQERAAQVAAASDMLMDELMLQPRSLAEGILGLYHRLINMHQHKWMYDGVGLAALLTSAGFVDPRIYHTIEGQLPRLTEIEKPGRILNGAGIAVEAFKT